MSRRRKHVLQDALQQEVKAPVEGQEIVRALGSRGDNLVEVCSLYSEAPIIAAGAAFATTCPGSTGRFYFLCTRCCCSSDRLFAERDACQEAGLL